MSHNPRYKRCKWENRPEVKEALEQFAKAHNVHPKLTPIELNRIDEMLKEDKAMPHLCAGKCTNYKDNEPCNSCLVPEVEEDCSTQNTAKSMPKADFNNCRKCSQKDANARELAYRHEGKVFQMAGAIICRNAIIAFLLVIITFLSVALAGAI